MLSKQLEETNSDKPNYENEMDVFKLREICQKLNEDNTNFLNENNQLSKELDKVNTEMLKFKEEYELNLVELSKLRKINQFKPNGHITFKIEEFSKFAIEGPESLRQSELVYIRGLPWKIEVRPKEKGRFLGFFLLCNTENKGENLTLITFLQSGL